MLKKEGARESASTDDSYKSKETFLIYVSSILQNVHIYS
jgi:hypothetical protein